MCHRKSHVGYCSERKLKGQDWEQGEPQEPQEKVPGIERRPETDGKGRKGKVDP